MKRSILKIALVIAIILLSICLFSNSSYAASVSITGNEPVVLTEKVETIEFKSTIEDLVDVLNAYKMNAGYNYEQYASDAVINATLTKEFSTDNIEMLATVAPEGATVKITPEVKDITYSADFVMPEGFSIDYTDTILHLPVGTTVKEAVDVFNKVGVAEFVACGEDYNINVDETLNTTTLHLNQGQDLQAIFDVIEANSLDDIIVAVPAYHVNLTGEKPYIWIEGDLTEEEVLDLVKDLKVDATAQLINDDSFTVELSKDGEPVVNRAEEPATEEPAVEEEKDDTPKTGAENLLGIAVATIVLGSVAFVILKRKNA